MTTITITGIVHLNQYGTVDKPLFLFHTCDMSKYGDTPIGPASFEFELPSDFNPRAAKIAALEREQEAVNTEFAKRTKELNDQIRQLQAIENGTDKPFALP